MNCPVHGKDHTGARAKLHARIRRDLAKFDYPSKEEVIKLILKQMETFAREWAPQAW
ncbi:type I restriction enzyme endonuclease domain-containing protein [Streptomyces sp. SCSIO 30461]|uniref:type I restriction enzyme endonuclease domain-containing protein n=1 Tax=Streptomyces sp. SCSIO 30461 TaxID=3118085 RepID=UPI0030D0FEE4